MQVRTIDLKFRGKPGVIASYLIEGKSGPVLVETGPASTLDHLRQGLADAGLSFGDLGDVFVTHIHLDHSGGAWALAEAGARIHVPARGARHLIEPERLVESARMVYGDLFDELWGEVKPIPEARVNSLEDGQSVVAGGVEFECWDAHGHAKHHQVFGYANEIAFVGDVAGCRIPGERFIALTSAPPQFDPDAWEVALDKLESKGYGRIFPTHFGPVDDVTDHLERFREVLRSSSELVGDLVRSGADEGEIRGRYRDFCKMRADFEGVGEVAWQHYESANPCDMCADGIALYWRKRLAEQ